MVDVHVRANGETWEVEHEGAIVSRHDSRDEAVAAGRDQARALRSDLLVHGEDGEVLSREAGDDAGTDPASPGQTLDDAEATAEPNEPA